MVLHDSVIYLLFVCPMPVLLAMWSFRSDRCKLQPGRAQARRVAPPVDERGYPACVDPDGTRF